MPDEKEDAKPTLADKAAKPTAEIWESAPKRGVGRPKAFDTPEELEDAINSYLGWVRDNPLYELKAFGSGIMLNIPKKRYPTVSGCALYCGVIPRTWRSWKTPDHPLSEVVEWGEAVMLQIKMEGAASGFFNSTIVARDVGLKEKTEVDANMTVNVIDSFQGENDV